MKRFLIPLLLTFLFVLHIPAQTDEIQIAQKIISEVVEKSFPELKSKTIKVKTFQSDSDYFRARFSFGKYLTFQKMQYIVFINPRAFTKNAPENGTRSIIAHELAHVLYYAERNRFELLGLVNLSSKNFTQKFEHRADLEAISRGYGDGLKEYRDWLYQNIPQKNLAEKQRDYFSPEEIDKVMKLFQQNSAKIVELRKNNWEDLDYLWKQK